MHTIKRLARIKRRENNRTASLLSAQYNVILRRSFSLISKIFGRFIFGHLIFGKKFSDEIIIDFGRFRTKISDIFKKVNKISDTYDLIMSRQIIHKMQQKFIHSMS